MISKHRKSIRTILAILICIEIVLCIWLLFKPAIPSVNLKNTKEWNTYYQLREELAQIQPKIAQKNKTNYVHFPLHSIPYLPAYSQNHWFRITNPDQKEMTFRAELDLEQTTDEPIFFAAKAKNDFSSSLLWKQAQYNTKKHRWFADFTPKELQRFGEIQVQVFRSMDQQRYFLTEKKFHITEPSLSSATINGKKAKRGKFDVQLTVEAPSGMDEMNVNIWSKPDKSDLHTYEPASQHNQSYTYEFNYKYHQYHVGHFQVEAVGMTSNGLSLQQSIENPYTVEAPPLEVEEYEIKDISGNQSIFLVSAKLSTEENVDSLRFPTWSEANGQDDLHWYKPKFNKKTSVWTQEIHVAKHRGGNKLLTEVYAEVKNKGRVKLHSSSFEVPESTFYYVQHRGNQSVAPENSLPAFEQVTHKGVETDVKLTADGQWIIMHDDTVDRTTNGTGAVSSLTLNQIRSLQLRQQPGQNYSANQLLVPTVREFLQVCQSKELVPFIEIKVPYATPSEYNDLARAIQETGFTQKAKIISFFFEPLQEMKRRLPEVQPLLLTREITPELINQAKNLGPNSGLDVRYSDLSPELVQKFKQAGLETGVWTVTPKNFRKVMDWQVEYVTTND